MYPTGCPQNIPFKLNKGERYILMKKQAYQTPEMEITRFEAEDIIRTSGVPDYGTDIMPEL